MLAHGNIDRPGLRRTDTVPEAGGTAFLLAENPYTAPLGDQLCQPNSRGSTTYSTATVATAGASEASEVSEVSEAREKAGAPTSPLPLAGLRCLVVDSVINARPPDQRDQEKHKKNNDRNVLHTTQIPESQTAHVKSGGCVNPLIPIVPWLWQERDTWQNREAS